MDLRAYVLRNKDEVNENRKHSRMSQMDICVRDDNECGMVLRGVSEFTCAIASLRMLLMCSSNDGVKSSQTTE